MCLCMQEQNNCFAQCYSIFVVENGSEFTLDAVILCSENANEITDIMHSPTMTFHTRSIFFIPKILK